jgi:hypothetical protein
MIENLWVRPVECGLLKVRVRRLFALEDAAGIDADQPVRVIISQAGSITHSRQPPGNSRTDPPAPTGPA